MSAVRRILAGAAPALDLLIAAALVPAGLVMQAFTRIGAGRLPRATTLLKRMGVFPIADHYYQPLFNDARLSTPLSAERELPGVDLDDAGQLDFLAELDRAAELKAMNLDAPQADETRFWIGNGGFGSGDAEFLYQFIRRTKPRRIVEIGSGNSTKIARAAVQRNAAEGGTEAEHICIEPYEQPWLERLGVKVVRECVENCPKEIFNALEPGDLLFVDSSHMIRPQGDVLFEYLYVLPTLKPGVFVHVHDIFTPRDYPDAWIRRDVRFWNEQYLLEALLGNRHRYRVVAALNYLKHKHFKALAAVCPYLDEGREPGSFYLEVVDR